jgi:AcrR family transcriptional regulator
LNVFAHPAVQTSPPGDVLVEEPPAVGARERTPYAVAVGVGRAPYAVAARELLRNTLLDAAREELQHRGWRKITMADIAQAAGVSRQTLYKEFGSRDDFVQALVLREGDRFLSTVEQAVNTHLDDPVTALSAAFEVFLDAIGEDRFVRTAVFSDGNESLLPFLTTRGKPLVEYAAARLSSIIRSGWTQVEPADAQLLAECLVRLAISYAALPAGATGTPATTPSTAATSDASRRSTTAGSVAALLGPYIERAVAGVL